MSTYPIGKLPAADLARLLARYTHSAPGLVVGPAVGQDAAVIDLGDRYLVVKTDPITFATAEIGWYAVNVNANDIACTGATPRWFLASLLLPDKSSTPALVEAIFAQIHAACTDLAISLVGGHTEITYGLDRPLVIGHMLGEVAPAGLISTAGAQVGDDLILTKGIAIEATALIASEKRSELVDYFGIDKLDDYANILHQPGISVVRDAAVATAIGGVHAMHDPTEGGVATGLHELAEAAGVGLEIMAEELPYLPETVALCQHFGLDPLGVIASGALLIAADSRRSGSILAALAEAGIKASRIGRVLRPEQGRQLVGPGGTRPLPTFGRDEITRLFE